MRTLTYQRRRGQLEAYFDRTAVEAWAVLTSDRPVSRIRETVRAGRDQMRSTLLDGLPEDLTGLRLLDAGCGTGALAVAAAQRGAKVTAIDLSAKLITVAQERAAAAEVPTTSISFRVGDMLDPALGRFDYIVAMDSLIHYRAPDMVEMIARLAERAERRVAVTFAPRTFLLTMMHMVGRFFPRTDRAPAIEPIHERTLRKRLDRHPALHEWNFDRSTRIASGFYTSQTMELQR